MIHVRIPATSANLGAGFDALGIAVKLYNEIEIEESDRLLIETAEGPSAPADESNFVYTMMKGLHTIYGAEMPPVQIRQWNRVPFARGLGSSSACVVGALLAANAMLNHAFTRQELLDIAARFEGHPDNVAPAFLGGFVCAAMEEKSLRFVRTELRDDLRFAALIPDFELETALARSVLPQ